MNYDHSKMRDLVRATIELSKWEPEIPELQANIQLVVAQIRSLLEQYYEKDGKPLSAEWSFELKRLNAPPYKLSNLLGLSMLHFKMLHWPSVQAITY